DASGVDAGGLDGGACAWVGDCATPPPSFTRCGGSSIDPAAAVAACEALNPIFDLGTDVVQACSAFSIVSGRYEVWCDGTELYVWASFDMLTSSDVRTCSFVVPLPDGGTASGTSRTLSWDLFVYPQVYTRMPSLSGMLVDARFGPSTDAAPGTLWTGSMASEGRMSLPARAPDAGVLGPPGNATLYYETQKTDCDDIPISGSQRIVLAIPIDWSP
ncbi:MAG: hypothetical protein GXP55_08240, partial [Deltaproteobacteria bacterium]|nr:hypothetical protein [Deltaproteobacteria bacterium]